MNRKEVTDVLERIQANRQFFLITKPVVDEWCYVLSDYDGLDVNKKLDEYFKDSDNFGKCPDVYYITKYLKTIEEKENSKILKAICPFCNRKINYEEYHEHYERCSSIDYLIEMSKRYLDKDLDRDSLIDLDISKFDKYYYSTCKLIYNRMPDGFPKHLLENVLLTYEGKEPRYGFEEIKKEVKENDRAC